MARAKTKLSPKATYVTYGYGQVEPNKLSARYNGKIFAQLPAAADIKILENGMFAKYDYKNKVVNMTGPGEWLLVFNEVKVYEDRETDADFAMIADNYSAIVYNATADGKYVHYVPGTASNADGARELTEYDNTPATEGGTPYGMMPTGTTMVPRLFKTDVGDIMTTNTIIAAPKSLAEGDILTVGTDGYLTKAANTPAAGTMQWQVVRVYTMPDLQPGVKIMRIV